MAARAGRDQDQPVHTRFQRLLRMTDVDHVMQHDAAVAVDRVDDLLGRRAQAGDENRHLVFDAHPHVMLEPRIRLMNDLVDGDRADHRVRMGGLVLGERCLDLREPFVEQLRRPRIERGERADDTGLALGQHEVRIADDEHRRGNNGQRKLLQDGGQCHGASLL